jgi:hypothetical protein
MKALSLKQPWAELVVNGRKTIETRTWNTPYRGKFLVHASLEPDWKAMEYFGYKELPTGCIVGEAELVDVKAYPTKEAFAQDAKHHEVHFFEWHKKRYGFLLKNVKRRPLMPCKGALNFFETGIEK